ncbi:hypothetical protein QE152_g26801 [Popillia japonica]|uniref:Uncharacterized protein n=1 Tax=Popillia japonica TaxID=7064 RepID=A0AAW1JY43_POPJA
MLLIEFRKKNSKQQTVKRRIPESDSEDPDDEQVKLPDSSDGEDFIGNMPELLNFEYLHRHPVPEEYVLVEFNGKQPVYYVRQIKSQPTENDFEVSFLRKSNNCYDTFLKPAVPDVSLVLVKHISYDTFLKPAVPDVSLVLVKHIKLILPPPLAQGLTKRQKGLLKFEINFCHLNVR